jgi:hypothetical protein
MMARRALWLLLSAAVLAGCTPAYCTDSCRFARDGECDDGRPGAATGLCELGTDCSDCGANPNLEPSDELDQSPSPPPGLGVGPRTSVPGGAGLPSCQCPSRAYCQGTPSNPIYEGAGQFILCGSGDPNCTHQTVRCPTNGPGPWSPAIEYECRDGDQGVGCYAINAEACHPVGTCGPPSNYGIDEPVDVPGGLTIEQCMRLATFLGPDDAGGDYLWDASQCETWYQVGSHRASCGACASACDVFLNDGPNPCRDAYLELIGDDPDPPDGVSPECRAQIEDQLRELERLSTGSSCVDRCLDRFVDCMEGSDCDRAVSCSNSANDCLVGCI